MGVADQARQVVLLPHVGGIIAPALGEHLRLVPAVDAVGVVRPGLIPSSAGEQPPGLQPPHRHVPAEGRQVDGRAPADAVPGGHAPEPQEPPPTAAHLAVSVTQHGGIVLEGQVVDNERVLMHIQPGGDQPLHIGPFRQDDNPWHVPVGEIVAAHADHPLAHIVLMMMTAAGDQEKPPPEPGQEGVVGVVPCLAGFQDEVRLRLQQRTRHAGIIMVADGRKQGRSPSFHAIRSAVLNDVPRQFILTWPHTFVNRKGKYFSFQ